MKNIAYKIAIIESEKGWGRKIDDYMVCLSSEDCIVFKNEFNSENTQENAPDWYMQVEGNPSMIELSDNQYDKLQSEKRFYLSQLNKIIAE